MANVNHDQLAGGDLHDNKVYPATGTPLPSWSATDGRYQAKGSVTGLPIASSTQAGVVNQTDWSTFNAKQAALGYTAVNKAGDTLTGTLIAPLQDSGGQVYNILGYGAKADAKSFTNGATTAGSAVFTSATANFTSADVGKIITIAGGYTGGVYFRTTIASWQSATQVTLASAAPLGVSGASFDYGTNNSTALQAAVNAAATAGGGTILIPVGTFLMGTDMSGDLKHNIWIKGSGRGATVLKLCGGIAPIAFGTGDATLNHVTKNIRVTDLTIDMNGQTGASYGLIAACCQDVSIDNIHIKNQANGAKSMLFFGVNSGASSAWLGRNLFVSNSIFSDSTGSWECITLAQSRNCKLVNCQFRDKAGFYNFLNYGSYDVSLAACDFYNCGNGVNGHGDTQFIGCNFFAASVTVTAYNTKFIGCSWRNLSGSYQGAITFYGNENAANETGWDSTPGAIEVMPNPKVIGCTFENCNTNSITASLFRDSLGNYHAPLRDLLISGCSFTKAYWRGIDVCADHLTIQDCVFVDSNQLNSGSVSHNLGLSGGTIRLRNIYSIDDQGAPTVNDDILIDRQASTVSAFPTTDVYLYDSELTRGNKIRCFNGAFLNTMPAGLNLYGENNIGLNPDKNYALGSITGATTVNAANGTMQTATLTGNVTITLTTSLVLGTQLRLVLTQDATGSRTATWPSNFKKAGGSLVLSTLANAQDTVTMRWSGSDWVEVGRALNVS